MSPLVIAAAIVFGAFIVLSLGAMVSDIGFGGTVAVLTITVLFCASVYILSAWWVTQ